MIFPRTPEQKAMIDAVSQLGVLMLLLLAGMETDLGLVKKSGRASFMVSMTGIMVPFACGFALGEMLPDAMLPNPDHRLVTSLFLGTALSISSVKIVAMVVREMNFMRRNVGQIIVATAVIDDTIGWIIIAIIFSLASRGSLDIFSVGQAVLGTLVFLGVSFTIGRRLVFQLIRWANDHLVSSAAVITVILLLMSGMALITHLIGVHTVLGAFVAGVLVGESPILTKQIDERLRGLITSLFMPVFFGRRCVPGRQPRRVEPQGILCARQRHECAGIDRGHHRDHRLVDGGAEPEPVLDDRNHGNSDHDGDAADAARGA
jgi:Kef-type K+ transport system membrane component KefB